ncbi:MAG: hypothetical protein COS94_06205 [Candidatus Hydrogenedentes bacterium CG07_land_8_20_14_0_80_42_17]|nr:MAG: hypothetical protein COS94_06205 [Candidatus Hydrogenedentes bacterium CG07_land_8_20_14_0_80_42_17]
MKIRKQVIFYIIFYVFVEINSQFVEKKICLITALKPKKKRVQDFFIFFSTAEFLNRIPCF